MSEISVLLPVYNAEKYLEECLDSIISQTYSNLEIVAIDDGSTDTSYSILTRYAEKDNRVKIYRNQENQGLANTLNIGLLKCNGRYIARMDADDLSHPNRIEKQVIFLQSNPDFSAVSSWMELFDESGEKSVVKYRTNTEEIKSSILFYSPVSHAASLFKADVLKEFGYTPEFIYSQDYDLWFRMMQTHKVGVLPEVLYFYRIHAQQSISVRKKNRDFGIKQNLVKKFHNYFKIDSSQELIDYHIEYCMNNHATSDFRTFEFWDNYLRSFLNKNKGLFKDEFFIKFVFVNYWQERFFSIFYDLKVKELIRLVDSPFCQFSFMAKMKLLLKKILLKRKVV